MTIGGSWGAYYWNGMIYSSELDRGFDIVELTPSAQLSANEIAAAKLVQLKEFNPQIRCISFQPDSPFHGLEGMKHMASAMVPKIYDPTLAESRLEISTEDAYAMCRRLARDEGVFVGPSAGANVTAALSVASQAEMPATIVTVLCDGGGRYLSENFWTAA